MNARAFLPVLGLLSLLIAACGGGGGSGDDSVLAVTAIPQAATLAPGETVSLTLTLTRRGADKAATLRVTRVPAGLMATWEPAELAPTVHSSVLTLRASSELAPGAHVLAVEVTEGSRTANLELPIEVVKASVSGTIHFQSGRPLATAIVEVIGHRAVLVDDAGAFEIPEVTLPYDLRVSWPETGSVHIYRGLESRTLALRPFVGFDRPDQLYTDFDVTLTNWDPTLSFRPWIYSEAQSTLIEWSTLPDANGRFRGGAIHHAHGDAVVQGVSLQRNADFVVTGYDGFLSAPMVLDEADGATGLSAELTPIDTFTAHPDLSLAPGLTMARMCPVVEQPNAAMELFCTAPTHGVPVLPELPSGELALLMEAVHVDGGLSRNVVRGMTPGSNQPAVTFHAPPVLESPASGATMEPGQSFLVVAPGEAPITLTLHQPGSLQEFHVTTREREIAFPDHGTFVHYPDSSSWMWTVRALPQATGWEVLEHGGVLGIQAAGDASSSGAPLGPQPATTRSQARPVSISGW